MEAIIKDTNKYNEKDKIMSYEDIDFSKFFSGKSVFIYFQKKLQKLTSVLYVLTAYLPENEPIRLKIRQVSMQLLEDVSEDNLSHVGSVGIVRLSSSIIFLLSVLRVGRESGYITAMNQQLLEKELLDVLALLEKHDSEVNSVPDLSVEDMEVQTKNVLLPKQSFLNKSFYTKDNTHSEPSSMVSHSESKTVKRKNVSQEFKYLNKRNSKKISNLERGEQIRSLVSSLGEVSIRDIVAQMPQVSSKTIQRALLNLVAEGVLKKVGERRWSKYSLMQQ